ncbi:MAG: phage major capsid protein [Chloroflexota bacterium]|nr:phage major capsid protein [Chloroflexota bacterium]
MSAIEEIQREVAAAHAFVRERVEPLSQEVTLLREEQERLAQQVSGALSRQREARREALRSASDRVRVQGGKLDGADLVDLAIVRSLMRAQAAQPQDYDPAALRAWSETVTRAMDSATAGAGKELVPQEEARQLWRDVNGETAVAQLFETVNMPSNPFDVPLQLGDVDWYPGAANTAPTGTDLTTAKQTLTAYELVGMVPWAYELDEDAVVAMLAEVRAALLRNAAQVLDDVVLNADTSATGNINHDGASLAKTAAGKAHYRIGFDACCTCPWWTTPRRRTTTTRACRRGCSTRRGRRSASTACAPASAPSSPTCAPTSPRSRWSSSRPSTSSARTRRCSRGSWARSRACPSSCRSRWAWPPTRAR